jgi:hypothetical protein
LGVETATSATITWPDGTKSDYPDLKANGFHTLTKGEAAVAVTPRD